MFDEKWLRDYQARTGCKAREYGAQTPIKPSDPPMPECKPAKYGNERTEADGIRFDSKHEAAVWKRICLEARSGEYCGVARQVAFFLPGGVKYIADFVTLKTDGSFQVWDAKSSATARNAVYRMKKKQMKECLGIEIREI